MEIKKLTSGDTTAVHTVMEKSFSNPWSAEAIESLIKSDQAVCLGAFEGEELLGYAFLECVLDEGSLTDIAVHPDFRRRGISRMLMDELVRCAGLRDLSFITLEVRVGNTPAINLYTRYGFEEVGKRPNYYTSPSEDALLMTKNL